MSIIGFGRFGRLLADILRSDFTVSVYDKNLDRRGLKGKKIGVVDLDGAMEADAVFFSPPIGEFERVIRDARDAIRHGRPKLLIDVLSVKTYPRDIFKKYIGADCEVLLTHPMFGPDSVKANNGISGFPIVIDRFTASTGAYSFWKGYFRSKGLRIVAMDADMHDRLAANSQGIAHFIGRALKDFDFTSTEIDTLGAKKLYEVMELAANDTEELFRDLQIKNPYAKDMRVKFNEAMARVSKKLTPDAQ